MLALLLTGCVNDSASFYIDGRNHALTLLRAQHYFWSDDAQLTLVAARLPDCQRRQDLMLAPASTVQIDVFANADSSWTLRSGPMLWRVDNDTCAISAGAPADAPGRRVGSFKVLDEALRFEAAMPAAAPAN
jgi:hypothetical protein